MSSRRSPSSPRPAVGDESTVDVDPSSLWTMVESAPDGMLMVDADGLILTVNRQLETLFGHDRSDLIGRSVEMLVPDRLRDVHRAHRTSFGAAPTMRAMGEGTSLRALRRDGSEFPVEISLSPVADGAVVASVRDITQRVATERRLALSEEMFRTSFERAPVGMALVRLASGAEWELERVNSAFAAMLDRSIESIAGTELGALTHPADRQIGLDAGAAIIGGHVGAHTAEQRLVRPDGSYVWTLVHATVIERAESIRLVMHTLDISDRLAREAERERLATMEDRERIARDIHDLVIQRVFGAGMKLQAVIPEMRSEVAVDRAHETIDELDSTIRELRSAIFALRRRDDERTASSVVEVAVEECVDRLGFRPTVTVSGADVEVPDDRLTELLATLREALSNVARHAGASSAEIDVAIGVDRLALTVTDDGIGIDLSRPHGHGLRNMSERAAALGGEFDVRPAAHGGTTVEWTVPLRSG